MGKRKRDLKSRKSKFSFWAVVGICSAIALLALVAISSSQVVNFHVADLGRHIMNGKVFLEQGFPITTNHYSYTETNFPATNHHWGSGVLYYWIEQVFGFTGLSVLNVSLLTFAMAGFLSVAWRLGGPSTALMSGLMVIPLITNRIEIRPEMFSNFFLGLEIVILFLFKWKKLKLKHLVVLPVIQVIWINTHIFFAMGWFIIGVFMLDYWLQDADAKKFKQAAVVVGASVLACLINPFHIHGLIEPFTILEEYGYMVAENQSVLFMQNRFGGFLYPWFGFLFGLSLLSFIPLLVKREWKRLIVPGLLWVVYSALAWKMVRNLPIYGFFLMPILAHNFSFALNLMSNYMEKNLRRALRFAAAAGLVFAFTFEGNLLYPFTPNSGLGLMPDSLHAAEFFKATKIKGKIFNNYDIGGYLIYNLFPNRKVFVDNRPEAYSVKFFTEKYNPMQEDEAVWKKVNERYNFNCIFFYRHDQTPHAQPFLIRRLQDPDWAPVYVDAYSIILLKRDGKDQHIIKQFELPADMFRSVPGGG